MRLECETREIELHLENAENPHILISGASGSGKTFMMKYLICHCFQNDTPAIVLGGIRSWSDVYSYVPREAVTVLQVDEDEILLRSPVKRRSAIYDLINRCLNIKSQEEKAALKKAVEQVIRKSEHDRQAEIRPQQIIDQLLLMDRIGDLADKMDNFFSNVNIVFLLEESNRTFQGHIFQIIEGDLSEQDTKQMYEMILWDCYYYQRKIQNPDKIMIFIDEFQNYMGPAIQKILTQGRELSLGICLVTQYVKSGFGDRKRGAIHQASSWFAFKPEDEDVTEVIRRCNTQLLTKNEWREVLYQLKRGQCLAFCPNSVKNCSYIEEERPRKITLVLDDISA